jgi:hypothetical protein
MMWFSNRIFADLAWVLAYFGIVHDQGCGMARDRLNVRVVDLPSMRQCRRFVKYPFPPGGWLELQGIEQRDEKTGRLSRIPSRKQRISSVRQFPSENDVH